MASREPTEHRNLDAYDAMDPVGLMVIPFVVAGLAFGVTVRQELLAGWVTVEVFLRLGLLATAALLGGFFWMRWCRRRAAAGWIRWAPVWGSLGGLVLGLVPDLSWALGDE